MKKIDIIAISGLFPGNLLCNVILIKELMSNIQLILGITLTALNIVWITFKILEYFKKRKKTI